MVGRLEPCEACDIKSEIPRVYHFFAPGIWKDDGYDFCQEIIDDTGMLEETGQTNKYP